MATDKSAEDKPDKEKEKQAQKKNSGPEDPPGFVWVSGTSSFPSYITTSSPTYITTSSSAVNTPIFVTASSGPLILPTSTYTFVASPREQALEKEIAELKERLAQQQSAYIEEQKKKGSTEEELRKKLDEVKATNNDLAARLTLSFILNRIHDKAKPPFLASKEFQDRFLKKQECAAFVMAVDLRRSTDLMLKSRTPEGFAQFITTLCAQLRLIILDEHGVFDKFTGDGILGFFPDFYTGEEAGYHAIAAAHRCHQTFASHYRQHRNSFQGVLMDVGLGIGIDYGTTHLVPFGGELSIVGEPVVYACRMAGAPADTTLLNQPAYEEILNRFSEYCSLEEARIEVKHEGPYLAYAVTRNEKQHQPAQPAWLKYLAKASESGNHGAAPVA